MSESVSERVPPSIDPVLYELVSTGLRAVCNEMALLVAKSAYSIAVAEGRDFAGAIYDRDGFLVAQGETDLPAFVGITMVAVPEVLRSIGLANMRPDDIYMINDPYVASTHCNDIHFVRPVFFEDQIIAFVSSTAHWSDVGGIAPGSINVSARSHYEEGVRIPAITIWRAGELNRDVVALLLHNMRESWERMGDLNAQTSAVRLGDRRICELAEKHGLAAVLAGMAEIQNQSERMMRENLRALPDGVYEAEDWVDEDVATGDPVAIRLRLTIDGDHADVDLTASDGAAGSGVNSTIAATTSAVFIAVGSILPTMPMNAGILRAMTIRTTPGSICHAQPPSAISATAASSMEAVIGAVTMAMSAALPARGAGVASTILNTTYHGWDTRDGFATTYICYIWSPGGMGGSRTRDGANVVGSPYASTIVNVPAELQERRFPLLYRRYQLLQNSGGPGRSRGGMAVHQLVTFPYVAGTLSTFGNRERFGPPGVFGGQVGRTAGMALNPNTEREQPLPVFSVLVPVAVGDLLSFWSAGGGGYGDPLERDPERVLNDVIDEYVSMEGARADYGVVVRELDRRCLSYEIDTGATAALRAELRAARAGS